LLKIGQLKEHQPDAAEIQRLLAAASRNLTDSRATNISPETRKDVRVWLAANRPQLLDLVR
jgi:hypothetical protein